MPIITLSRELGSRGDDVAVAVAERLGLRLVGREIINRAAQSAGAGEVALADIDELGLLGVKPSAAAIERYREKITEVIEEQAAQGDVLLVGRGGRVVLRGRPGVLHVRIAAPPDQRIATVSSRCNISPEVAAARIAASDRARAAFLRRTFGVRWDDPALFDLVLNMAQLGVQTAADILCAGALAVANQAPVTPQESGA